MVGGIATAAGLVFTASELRRNRLEARDRALLELRDLRVQARRVRLEVTPATKHAGLLTKCFVTVTNKSDHYLTDISLLVDGRRVGVVKEQLHPDVPWTWKLKMAAFADRFDRSARVGTRQSRR